MTEDTHVLFVAADRDRCSREARVLENAAENLAVAGATCVAGVRTALSERPVDCVVFGENPLTADGSDLLAVTDLCGDPPGREEPIPVILYTDGSYDAGTARATEGVTDYVCADGANAVAHLVDRIRWTTGRDEDREFDHRLVESIDDGVFVFDDDGGITYANDAMEAVLGRPADAFLGESVQVLADRGLVDAADADAVAAAVESAIAGEADSMSPEVTVETPEGETRVVEFDVVGFPGDSAGAMATVRNVTEYRRTESALAETKTKIERLHGVTDEMGACRSERELFELAVDAADRVLDADVCGIDTVDDGRFVPQATVGDYDGGPIAGVGERALRAGDSILVADATPEGSPVAGARSVLAVPIENVALFRAVAREPNRFDERDRHLAELLVAHVAETLTRIRVGETLRRRERDLVAERERLVALFEHVPHPTVGYSIEDGRPVVRNANPSFESTYGVDAADVIGDSLTEHVDPVDDTDLGRRLVASEQVETTVTHSTVDGERDFLVTAGSLEGVEGEGYLVFTDITEQAERERDLQRERDRLDEFAAVAAAELREQLNDARGYLELSTETDDPEHVAEVRRAHETMRRLLDDLRYLADEDSSIEFRALQIEDVATTAWASVETGAADLEVEDGTVEADPEHLLKLLEQLLRNAADHGAPEAGPLLGDIDDSSPLTVRVGPTGNGFFVEDTGTGVPPEEREAVFESGVSTREDRSGLGLQVVERIADAHGWRVELTESEEGGARFEIQTERTWITPKSVSPHSS